MLRQADHSNVTGHMEELKIDLEDVRSHLADLEIAVQSVNTKTSSPNYPYFTGAGNKTQEIASLIDSKC